MDQEAFNGSISIGCLANKCLNVCMRLLAVGVYGLSESFTSIHNVLMLRPGMVCLCLFSQSMTAGRVMTEILIHIHPTLHIKSCLLYIKPQITPETVVTSIIVNVCLLLIIFRFL